MKEKIPILYYIKVVDSGILDIIIKYNIMKHKLISKQSNHYKWNRECWLSLYQSCPSELTFRIDILSFLTKEGNT